MATDHADVVLSDRKSPVREDANTDRGDATAVPASERDIIADPPNSRKSAHFLRGGVSVLTVTAFVVLVLGRRTALTRSLGRIGHPEWSWISLAVLLEASSMVTFAMMQRRLFRVGGRRVGTRPMMATTFAANALSVSVPVAGPELGAAFTFRRFKEQGADTSLAGWTLLAGGLASWFGAIFVLGAGGLLSGNVVVTGVTVIGALLGVFAGLALWVGVGRTGLRLVGHALGGMGDPLRVATRFPSHRRSNRSGQWLDRGSRVAAPLEGRVGQDRWVGAGQLAD